MASEQSTLKTKNKNDFPFNNGINVSADVVKRLQDQMAQIKSCTAQLEQNQISFLENPSNESLYQISFNQQRQIQDELDKNDLYWKGRIEKMERNSSYAANVMRKELGDAVKVIEQQFQRPSQNLTLPISCQELKNKLSECYKIHSTDSLTCIGVLNDFSKCINRNLNPIDDKSNNNNYGEISLPPESF